MFQKVNRFVNQFRELEKQEFSLTEEEEKRWRSLKEKLSSPTADGPNLSHYRRLIVFAGLYPRVGTSFLASNLAYYLAGKGTPTTLCELPRTVSHYYFALDFERRAHPDPKETTKYQLLMQNNQLKIHVDTTFQKRNPSHVDITNWLLMVTKDSPCVVVDLSSQWDHPLAEPVLEIMDEMWMVIDGDVSRLTQLMLSQSPPPTWQSKSAKVKLLANRWSPYLSRMDNRQKVEGTLSLWDELAEQRKLAAFVPHIDSEKVSRAQSKACLLLEMYPEECKWFEAIARTEKGRVL